MLDSPGGVGPEDRIRATRASIKNPGFLPGRVPAWVVLAVRMLGWESVGFPAAVGVAVGVAGAAVTTRFWEGASGWALDAGDVFAVVNGVLLAAMILLARVARAQGPSSWDFARRSFGYALVFGICYFLVSPGSWTIPTVDAHSVLLLAVSGLVGTAAAYWLLYVGTTGQRIATSGIWLLSEPAAVVGGFWLLRGEVSVSELSGAALILLACLIILRPERESSTG